MMDFKIAKSWMFTFLTGHKLLKCILFQSCSSSYSVLESFLVWIDPTLIVTSRNPTIVQILASSSQKTVLQLCFESLATKTMLQNFALKAMLKKTMLLSYASKSMIQGLCRY